MKCFLYKSLLLCNGMHVWAESCRMAQYSVYVLHFKQLSTEGKLDVRVVISKVFYRKCFWMRLPKASDMRGSHHSRETD